MSTPAKVEMMTVKAFQSRWMQVEGYRKVTEGLRPSALLRVEVMTVLGAGYVVSVERAEGLHALSPARYPVGAEARSISGIARCKRCKSAKRVEGFASKGYAGYGRYEWREHWPTLACGCGREYPMVQRIKATLSEKHKCDSRCTNAKGPTCVCSCGGANHGSGL